MGTLSLSFFKYSLEFIIDTMLHTSFTLKLFFKSLFYQSLDDGPQDLCENLVLSLDNSSLILDNKIKNFFYYKIVSIVKFFYKFI